ncbi:MAG: ATP synthase F1 subunit gamma [Myxococcales bacterium]|nr:MAG: ATP synthase F1 subunit gamma [Myxococcales bacterium]
MPSLKAIRTRIATVKSTQKITRAMKMVAGARLNRAQQRIVALRPYATKTQEVLSAVVASSDRAGTGTDEAGVAAAPLHPLLQRRAVKRTAYILITSDRGLCGAFNTNINKTAERRWRADVEAGREAVFYVVGRKGRDYLRRRNMPVAEILPGVWDKLDMSQARMIAAKVLKPLRAGEIDSIALIFSSFKSAIAQEPTVLPLLPVAIAAPTEARKADAPPTEYLFEPDPRALLDQLLPMYLEITLMRALYDSQASEFGARMTAMDAATKNAKEMIISLTLQYNRARQAAITRELMEIIGGAEALKE